MRQNYIPKNIKSSENRERESLSPEEVRDKYRRFQQRYDSAQDSYENTNKMEIKIDKMYDNSPEMRYIEPEDEETNSPYDKRVTPSQIQEKINESMSMKEKQQKDHRYNESRGQYPQPSGSSPIMGRGAGGKSGSEMVSSSSLGERYKNMHPGSYFNKDRENRERERFGGSPNAYSDLMEENKYDISPNRSIGSRKSSKSPYRSFKQSPMKGQYGTEAIYEEFDKNVLLSENLLKQAHLAGKKNLTTTALLSESPYKYERPRLMQQRRKSNPKTKEQGKYPYMEIQIQDSSPSPLKKSQDYLPIANPSTSNQILSRIFDGDLSIHSPSKKQQLHQQHIQQQYLPHPQQHSQSQSPSPSPLHSPYNQSAVEQQPQSQTQELQQQQEQQEQQYGAASSYSLETAFEAALQNMPRLAHLTIQDQLLKFGACIHNIRKDVRLGGVLAVYMLRRGRNVPKNIEDHILQLLLSQISHYESQDDNFLICGLELISVIGVNELSLGCIPIIKSIMFNSHPESLLQITCVNTLVSLGYEGLFALIEIANKDYHNLQNVILARLCQIPFIQKNVLVPGLLFDLDTIDSYKKQITLAALNRCYHLIHGANGIPTLVGILEDGSVERQIVASALRAVGKEGEQTLIKLLRYHPNPKVRIASASVLCWRRPCFPPIIKFVLETTEIISVPKTPPGNMSKFFGKNTGIAFEPDDYATSEDYIEINVRDMIAALQRFLSHQNNYENIELGHYDTNVFLCDTLKLSNVSTEDASINNAVQQLRQLNLYEKPVIDYKAREKITSIVIKALTHSLQDEVIGVRETGASSLGTISLPEALDSLDMLIQSTKDSDPNVRAMSSWAIGRLGPQVPQKAIKPLIDLMKDTYWKVRTASCIAVGSLGSGATDLALPYLLKMLKDGSVNKQIVGESIVSMGPKGIQAIIDFMKNKHHSNFKLREYMVKSLATCETNHSIIDHVIELLFYMSNDLAPSVRKATLISLDMLRKEAKDAITYLKARHLLPFYYQFLSDKSQKVRKCALICIKNFGAQGELLFIEGVTKDKNPNIRKECASGLGEIGATTFRTLLLALHDSDASVRDAACQAISKGMSVQYIQEAFEDKPYQKQAIKCAIKEVLTLPYAFNSKTIGLLQLLLNELEKDPIPNTEPCYDSPHKREITKVKNNKISAMLLSGGIPRDALESIPDYIKDMS